MAGMYSFPGRLWIVFVSAGTLAIVAMGPEASAAILRPGLPLALLLLLASALFAETATTTRLAGRGEWLPSHALIAALSLWLGHRLEFMGAGRLTSMAASVLAPGGAILSMAVLTLAIGRFRSPRTKGLVLTALWIAFATSLKDQPMLLRRLLCGLSVGGEPPSALLLGALTSAALLAWILRRRTELRRRIEEEEGRPLPPGPLNLPNALAQLSLGSICGLAGILVASSLFPYLASFGATDWKAIHGRARMLGLAVGLVGIPLAPPLGLPVGLPYAAVLALAAALMHGSSGRKA